MNPSEFVPLVKGLFTEPEATLGKYKGKGDFAESFIIVFAVVLIGSVISFLVNLLFSAFSKSAATDIAIGGLSLVLGLVLGPIIFFLGSGVYYVLSRIFGGTGSFKDQTYLFALVYALSVISSVLGIIPCLGAIVSLVIGLYMIYLGGLVLKTMHGFSLIKSLIIILIPVVILGLLAVALFAATVLAFIGMAGSSGLM